MAAENSRRPPLRGRVRPWQIASREGRTRGHLDRSRDPLDERSLAAFRPDAQARSRHISRYQRARQRLVRRCVGPSGTNANAPKAVKVRATIRSPHRRRPAGDGRNFGSHRFRDLEVDHQPEAHRLLRRQVGRLLSMRMRPFTPSGALEAGLVTNTFTRHIIVNLSNEVLRRKGDKPG
jgi:hypothetical protein